MNKIEECISLLQEIIEDNYEEDNEDVETLVSALDVLVEMLDK